MDSFMNIMDNFKVQRNSSIGYIQLLHTEYPGLIPGTKCVPLYIAGFGPVILNKNENSSYKEWMIQIQFNFKCQLSYYNNN